MEFAFTVLGGAVAGYMLDAKFKTKPYITVFMIIAAFLVNIKIMFIMIKRAKESMEGPDAE